MPNDIKGLPPGGNAPRGRAEVQAKQNQALADSAAQVKASVQEQVAKTTARPDTVQLSDQAQALMKMEQRAAQGPSTNSQKIAQIRAALAEGTYQIDAEAVAKKMIDFDALF